MGTSQSRLIEHYKKAVDQLKACKFSNPMPQCGELKGKEEPIFIRYVAQVFVDNNGLELHTPHHAWADKIAQEICHPVSSVQEH